MSQIPASLDSEQPPLQLLARAAPDPMAKGTASGEQPPRCARGAAGAQPPARCESTSDASTANFLGPGALAAAHSEISALLFLITYWVTDNIWKIKICAQPAPARGVQHPAGASPSSAGSGLMAGSSSQGIYWRCSDLQPAGPPPNSLLAGAKGPCGHSAGCAGQGKEVQEEPLLLPGPAPNALGEGWGPQCWWQPQSPWAQGHAPVRQFKGWAWVFLSGSGPR